MTQYIWLLKVWWVGAVVVYVWRAGLAGVRAGLHEQWSPERSVLLPLVVAALWPGLPVFAVLCLPAYVASSLTTRRKKVAEVQERLAREEAMQKLTRP